MNDFAEMLRRMGALLGMAAFGLVLVNGLMTGSDPLFALVRAGGSASAILFLFFTLCRTLVPLLGAQSLSKVETAEKDSAESA